MFEHDTACMHCFQHLGRIDVIDRNLEEVAIEHDEVGKRADLIVIDRNLFEVPVADIDSTQILRTYLDGQLVYER